MVSDEFDLFKTFLGIFSNWLKFSSYEFSSFSFFGFDGVNIVPLLMGSADSEAGSLESSDSSPVLQCKLVLSLVKLAYSVFFKKFLRFFLFCLFIKAILSSASIRSVSMRMFSLSCLFDIIFMFRSTLIVSLIYSFMNPRMVPLKSLFI